MRVLLVEDDEDLGKGVKTGLTQYGYAVDWLRDGESASQALKMENFDMVVLDLGLPGMDGLKVLQNMRAKGSLVPVLILTAKETIDDRIKGLDAGADDYMSKPFDLDELCARLRALQRRSAERASSAIEYKNITIDPASHVATLDDLPLNLPRREFALLLKLLENQGRALSREQLSQSLYSWDEDVDSNALEVHIHNLRKKFGAALIRTIRGVGYMVEKADKAQETTGE